MSPMSDKSKCLICKDFPPNTGQSVANLQTVQRAVTLRRQQQGKPGHTRQLLGGGRAAALVQG